MNWDKIQTEIENRLVAGELWKITDDDNGITWVTNTVAAYAIPTDVFRLPLSLRHVNATTFNNMVNLVEKEIFIDKVVNTKSVSQDNVFGKNYLKKNSLLVCFDNNLWAYKQVIKNFLDKRFSYYGSKQLSPVIVKEGNTIVGLFMGVMH